LPDWDENILYPIAIYSRGKRKVIKFTYAELVDCPNNQEAQKTIENRLSTLICLQARWKNEIEQHVVACLAFSAKEGPPNLPEFQLLFNSKDTSLFEIISSGGLIRPLNVFRGKLGFGGDDGIRYRPRMPSETAVDVICRRNGVILGLPASLEAWWQLGWIWRLTLSSTLRSIVGIGKTFQFSSCIPDARSFQWS